MKYKRKNFMCYTCKSFAEWVLMNNEWHCCSCNPLLLDDEFVKECLARTSIIE